jgi:hypothetical protein
MEVMVFRVAKIPLFLLAVNFYGPSNAINLFRSFKEVRRLFCD